MTRGALVLFVGVFSVVFLRRRLQLSQLRTFLSYHLLFIINSILSRWLALVAVMVGVSVVGLSGLLAERKMKEDSLLAHAVSFFTEPDGGPEATQQATKVLAG